MEKVRDRLMGASGSALVDKLSDFHLLMFIHGTGVFTHHDFLGLIAVVKDQSDVGLLQNSSWHTLGVILKEVSNLAPQTTNSATSTSQKEWSCTHCTYLNPGSKGDCGMCGLPK